ncbi:MAG: hypothetical protein M3Y17_16210 [Actinomycetota bacterium]|nr:hypothetical protein [Actinomycetota bacterium]
MEASLPGAPGSEAELVTQLLNRFDGATLDMLTEVLTPLQVEITEINLA